MAHEETRHLHQHRIAFSVAVLVVVLLEVVDIEVDATPIAIRLRLALTRDGVQIPTIVAACERIPDAQLQELCLKLLPVCDVDEDSVAVFLARLGIHREKSAVDYRSCLAVTTRELKLDVPNRSLALE